MADRLQWESLLTSVMHELPQPVSQEAARDGSIILVGGDPGEVIVRLTRTMAAVSEYAIEWDGPEEPVVRPILFGTILWRRMPEVHGLASLNTLIRAARESRRAKYVVCRVCDRGVPPEHLFDDDTCDECRAS
jgi:hypothetical protein